MGLFRSVVGFTKECWTEIGSGTKDEEKENTGFLSGLSELVANSTTHDGGQGPEEENPKEDK